MRRNSSFFSLLFVVAVVHGRSTHHQSPMSSSSSLYESRVDDYSPLRYYEVRYVSDDSDESAERSLESRGAVKSGLTQQQIQEIVDAHNQLRAKEGASNMEVMKWNPQLAILGQKWADGCRFEHGQPHFNENEVGYKQMGQNLYASTDPAKTMKDGVQAWYDEKADYTYDNMGCKPGKMCGHYTQVVWGTSREVGCGLTLCSEISGMKNANYLVCNYGPAGNWAGQKPFKKGAACTQCDSGKFFCTSGLCDFSCNAPGSSSCKCEAKCGNCGTQSNDCKCKCKPGWSGVACNEQCKDMDAKCGGNPGWPAGWCDPAHQFVLDKCPKLCKKCEAATGATCSLKSGDARNKDSNKDDKSEDRGNFQAELSEFVEKIQGHLKRNGDSSEDSDEKTNKGHNSDDDKKRRRYFMEARDHDSSDERDENSYSKDGSSYEKDSDESDDKKRRRYFMEARDNDSSDERDENSYSKDGSSYEKDSDDSKERDHDSSSDDRNDSSDDDDKRLANLLAKVEKLVGHK